jgi:outer membrane protein assembly factor BamB
MRTLRNTRWSWMIFGCLLALITTWAVAVPELPADAIPGFPNLSARNDWPWWRGPTHDGVATVGQSPPLQWSETENILWSCPVPGRGHGSVTVVGNQVFLVTADVDQGVQLVVCINRSNGDLVWRTEVHRGGLETTKGNAKSTLASSTIASDGRRLFINFLNAGAVYATALTLDGEKIWQTKVSDFVIHQGYGASPLLHGSLVIVAADNKGGGAIAALDQSTGKIVWKNERPAKANYTSPILLNVSGQEQLLFSGCDLVTSLDPQTGRKIWETEGSTTECVTSIVSDGERIFTSGGYPRNHMSAIRADSTGKIDWESTTRVYVPSMIVREGFLYAVLDAGFAACWKSATGEEMWKERIGGTFSSSLVLVGENLLATNEEGRTVVFKADPKGFEKVAESQLGDECFATPAVCGNRIYHRIAKHVDGKRQEFVYCIGKP